MTQQRIESNTCSILCQMVFPLSFFLAQNRLFLQSYFGPKNFPRCAARKMAKSKLLTSYLESFSFSFSSSFPFSFAFSSAFSFSLFFSMPFSSFCFFCLPLHFALSTFLFLLLFLSSSSFCSCSFPPPIPLSRHYPLSLSHKQTHTHTFSLSLCLSHYLTLTFCLFSPTFTHSWSFLSVCVRL